MQIALKLFSRLRYSSTSVPSFTLGTECPLGASVINRVSLKNIRQEYPSRISVKNIRQEYRSRISVKNIGQEYRSEYPSTNIRQRISVNAIAI